jgi:DNA-binding response OmpR family regulator
MNDLLLVEATEDLQTLADGLAQAGFRITTSPLADAEERLRGGKRFDGVIINMTEPALAAAASSLLASGAAPERTATVGIVRRDQVEELDPALPLDDFAVYPAGSEEVAMRLRRALQRRSGGDNGSLIRCGDLAIDQESYRVFVAGEPVDLTYKEYELLRFLALSQDKVCTRETLLNRVWGYDFYGGARTVDVHIRRLRSKIETPGHSLIETVRNVGYRLRCG